MSIRSQPADSTPARPSVPVNVTVGGIPATVQYAGGAPGEVAGLMQVNVQIPTGIPSGDSELLLTIGSATSRKGVTVSVQ